MKPGIKNSYNSLSDITIGEKKFKIYSLAKAEKNGLDNISKLKEAITEFTQFQIDSARQAADAKFAIINEEEQRERARGNQREKEKERAREMG